MNTKSQERDAATNSVARLPFVCDTPEDKERPRHFWCVRPSGGYVADCATGASYGLAALRHMRDIELTPLLGWVVSDMIQQKRGNGSPGLSPDGLVIGFCSVIAAVAVAAAEESFLERVEQHYRDGARLAEEAGAS